MFRSEDELQQKLLHNAPPSWSAPGLKPEKAGPSKPPPCLRVRVIYGAKEENVDPKSWTDHFRKLETNHSIQIVEVEDGAVADYWILDTNTSDGHYDTGDFQSNAREAKVLPLAVNTPSNLVVRSLEERVFLFSMRSRARD